MATEESYAAYRERIYAAAEGKKTGRISRTKDGRIVGDLRLSHTSVPGLTQDD